MTKKLTRDWLQQRITDMESTRDDIPFGFDEDGNNELAAYKMALAAMNSEPYGFTDGDRRGMIYEPHYADRLNEPLPVYRHAQQPVVPDESYQQLSELYHAQEKRLFKIAQRIKGSVFDKYSHSPSQAIDVLEGAIFGENNACGAAMLQAHSLHAVKTAPALGSLQKTGEVLHTNSPVIPDGWTGNDKANAALIMLDRIETVDPVDDDRIEGVKRIIHELAAAPQEVK